MQAKRQKYWGLDLLVDSSMIKVQQQFTKIVVKQRHIDIDPLPHRTIITIISKIIPKLGVLSIILFNPSSARCLCLTCTDACAHARACANARSCARATKRSPSAKAFLQSCGKISSRTFIFFATSKRGATTFA
jgi:hypothetical protein